MDTDALEQIAARVRTCTACRLHETRNMAVPGEGGGHFGHAPPGGTLGDFGGDAGAEWSGLMLVGEAPGRNEDETGRPFCGAAGKNLDLGLSAAGLRRDAVFVTSINKCRPPKNRDPKPDEKAACKPFLLEQIAALRPRVLVALGRHGLSGLVESPPKTFGDVRGTFMDGPPDAEGVPIPVFCSLHPAAIIYRQTWREQYLDDWQALGLWVRKQASCEAPD